MDQALTPDNDPGRLYEADFAAWALDQAARLRLAADSDNVPGLDWRNLAEEIEALARRDRRELASHLRTIAEHLMKLQASPAADPRNAWEQSVRTARQEIELILNDSPSLRRAMPEIAAQMNRRARKDVASALNRYAETPKLPVESLDYTPEQLVGDWFPG